jgi:hypothetical protein
MPTFAVYFVLHINIDIATIIQANYINALAVSVLPFLEPAGRIHWVDILLHWVIFYTDLAARKETGLAF